MKNPLITGFFMASASTFFGQTKIEYNLCDLDFRPLSLHNDLPQNAIYTNSKASATARALDVVNRLTFDEKLTLTGGWNSMHFPGVPCLGSSPVYFYDASQGIHVKNLCVKVGKSTSFPCELALAATWDPELAYTYAKSIGDECQTWGINVLLGPGLNMYRNSGGGRNFEYMGEDPFPTSAMTVQYIKALQSTKTIATIKHFLGKWICPPWLNKAWGFILAYLLDNRAVQQWPILLASDALFNSLNASLYNKSFQQNTSVLNCTASIK